MRVGRESREKREESRLNRDLKLKRTGSNEKSVRLFRESADEFQKFESFACL